MKRNNQNGGFIVLACALIFVLLAFVMFLFHIWKLSFHYQNAQSLAESTALQAAEKLNENDCIGKINNLTARSRELVFDSRAAYNATLDPDYFFLEPLGRQLLDQSRYGAAVIEQGRKQLIASRLDEVERLLQTDETLANHKAEIIELEVGIPKNAQSNVYEEGADELQDFDMRKGYINDRTKSFFGNINAKLPQDDADLNFKLSPLQGVIGGQVKQTALLSAVDFIKTAQLIANGETAKKINCEQMPSAIKLEILFPTDRDLMANGANSVLVSASAMTHGGQPMP